MKKLVLCADDFALTQGISEGIAHLGHQGRISATSVMVLTPRWPGDVSLLEPLRGKIDVGLHLDWTSDAAVDAGHGLPLQQAMLVTWLKRFDLARVKQIIGRQLDEFERVWGEPPDHIDGHQHIHQFPHIRNALVEVVVERYPQGSQPQPYFRISRLAVNDSGFKGWVISAMGAQALRRSLQSKGMAHAPALAGVYDFSDTTRSYQERMEQWLQSSPAGTLVMCHPANQAIAADEIGTARLAEYAHLSSDAFQAQLQGVRVEVVRGSALYQPIGK